MCFILLGFTMKGGWGPRKFTCRNHGTLLTLGGSQGRGNQEDNGYHALRHEPEHKDSFNGGQNRVVIYVDLFFLGFLMVGCHFLTSTTISRWGTQEEATASMAKHDIPLVLTPSWLSD